MLIEVTPEDIRHGIKGGCSNCPVALAVLRACNLGTFDDLMVDYRSVRIRRAGKRYRYAKVPSEANEWMHSFDYDLDLVEPFSFKVTFQ